MSAATNEPDKSHKLKRVVSKPDKTAKPKFNEFDKNNGRSGATKSDKNANINRPLSDAFAFSHRIRQICVLRRFHRLPVFLIRFSKINSQTAILVGLV